MKAKEAAQHVIENGTPADAVKNLVPEYPNVLHRNQWISTFVKALPADLQPAYREALLPPKKK